MKRKIQWMLTICTVAYAPLMEARIKAPYPEEKLAAFVVEKLDVTSLPSPFRPKKEKGKKTMADYGYSAEQLGENEALVSGGTRSLSIKILEESPSGIFACVAEPGQSEGSPKVQSVIRLKRKDPNALLKGRVSWKEFKSCPTVGGNDEEDFSSSGG